MVLSAGVFSVGYFHVCTAFTFKRPLALKDRYVINALHNKKNVLGIIKLLQLKIVVYPRTAMFRPSKQAVKMEMYRMREMQSFVAMYNDCVYKIDVSSEKINVFIFKQQLAKISLKQIAL